MNQFGILPRLKSLLVLGVTVGALGGCAMDDGSRYLDPAANWTPETRYTPWYMDPANNSLARDYAYQNSPEHRRQEKLEKQMKDFEHKYGNPLSKNFQNDRVWKLPQGNSGISGLQNHQQHHHQSFNNFTTQRAFDFRPMPSFGGQFGMKH